MTGSELIFWFNGILFGVIATLIFVIHLRRAEKKKHYPYSWSCGRDNCEFSVETNDFLVLDRMASNHEKGHADGSN